MLGLLLLSTLIRPGGGRHVSLNGCSVRCWRVEIIAHSSSIVTVVVDHHVAEEHGRVRQVVGDGRNQLLRLLPSNAARASIRERAAHLLYLIVLSAAAAAYTLTSRARPVLHQAGGQRSDDVA